ncbi:MAG: CHAP domain-containing protein [Polaromonas sp.]|uniref:CHAP domain-containing protein n=1 Tax=Polaromonas sp. TaxID=1869339 RepID=UPI0027304F24|nr:CHAP domain-containing protein [Polaromonas sp.]MDP1742639.1 CHAP domain-containing protein [Polaromonas sp.]MDP1955593.1 CHAP domain-containing protein [Polaromonas sp.]MDP3752515.1 CHAP domain-containing protein [Polaromonas sp.]
MRPVPFPGIVASQGISAAALVSQVQQALVARGYGPFTTGVFDAAMTSSVMLFQSQHDDADRQPLVVDGEVGRHTWAALFGGLPVTPASAPSSFMLQALGVAGSQVGQVEEPRGSNRGTMVDEYLKAVGVPLQDPNADTRAWCMAFVYWAFNTASVAIGRGNPLPKTAGVLKHWTKAANVPGSRLITAGEAFADPTLIKPGIVFILDFGSGLGHTGIVERVMPGGRLATVEGNTNNDGSRTGVGVFRLERRKLNDPKLVGFVDYTNA